MPSAREAYRIASTSYTLGGSSALEVIDAQRTLLDVRLMIVESKAEREKKLAEMEELAGVDVETLGKK